MNFGKNKANLYFYRNLQIVKLLEMSQLIITTDVSSIRPVFADGTTENIKRYNQLKKLFENSKEYRILAEPVAAGGDKIAWHTEYEGTIIPLRKLDEDEQETVKRLLKIQVNKIYKSIVSLIDEDDKRNALFSLIDSCIEIPDFDDIYIVQNANGEKNFCLVRWGFVNEDFNAPKGLIKSLIPLKVADINIRAIKGNNKLAIGEKIIIEYNGKKEEFVTDEKARIQLNDVNLLSEIRAYQEDENGDKIYEQTFVVEKDADFTFFIGNQSLPKQNVNIQTLDEDDNILSNVTLKIKYDDVEFTTDSDAQGQIELGELFVGTKVLCSQVKNDKEIKTIEFEVQQGKNIYFVRVLKQKTKGRVELRIIDEFNKPIPYAEMQAKFADGSIKYYNADEKGIIEINDIPFKEEIVFRQIIDRLPQFQQTVRFTEDEKIIFIKGKQIKTPLDFTYLTITVLNAHDEPISNLRVRVENGVKSYHQISDSKGKVYFEKIDCKEKTTVVVEYDGKRKEEQIICQGKETEHVIKLGNKMGLLWLWILLIAVIVALIVVLLPKINSNSKNTIPVDTTQNIAQDTIANVQTKGMKLKLLDEQNNPLTNAKVSIKYDDTTYSKVSDENGQIIFEHLLDSGKTVTAIVKAPKYGEQRFTFVIKHNKTLKIKNESSDISEIILPCGTNVKSKGYHSTIKTFNMHKTKGGFLLTYNMNRIPDMIFVYTGDAEHISEDKIIYQSKKPEQFIHKRWLNFNSPDSLITVRIQGGDTTLTQWDFTVGCAK
jgi:hypothetical protein